MSDPVNSLHRALRALHELFKGPAASFCRLSGSADDSTLLADDGSLLSVLKIEGLLNPAAEDPDSISQILGEKIGPLLDSRGHYLKFVFDYDPSKAEEDSRLNFRSAVSSARRSGLRLEDLIESQIRFLSERSGRERFYCCLWSSERELFPREAKRKGSPGDLGAFSGSAPAAAGISAAHQGALASLERALFSAGLLFRRLDAAASLGLVREFVYGAKEDAFRPVFFGEGFPLVPETPFDPLYPSLKEQIFHADCEVLERDFLRAENTLHAPFFVSVFPREKRTFKDLFRLLTRGNPPVPARLAFSLSPPGKYAWRLKTALARILSLSSPENRRLAEAAEALALLAEKGESLAALSVSLDTSLDLGLFPNVPAALTELRRRKAELMKTISGWGECQLQSVAGDPLLGVCAALPGLLPHGGPAPKALAPVKDALRLIPLRPASPWEEGPLAFLSPDGKLLPFSPSSSVQAAWIDLGLAPMGAGKSLLLNAVNLAFCLKPGLFRPPLLAVVDVGPGSKALVDLLRSALPAERRHEAVHVKLRLSRDEAVNPFDTPLGLRAPLPQHLSFLVNFFSLLSTPPGAETPPGGAEGMIRQAVLSCYREKEIRGTLWTEDLEPEIRLRALKLGFPMSPDATVWEGVDFLFRKKEIHPAILLQRRAVPVLEDLILEIRQNPSLKAVYGYRLESGEGVLDYVWRALSEALRDYPLLSGPTLFSLGDARVVSLDLDEAAGRGGSPAAARRTAVMYMLARHLAAGRFFLMPEDLPLMPELYREHHRREIESIRTEPKRLCYDELHRVTGERAFVRQIAGDLESTMRESRKWNLSIGLYSQSVEDFPQVMLDLATSVFLLGCGTQEGARILSRVFGLEGALKEDLLKIGKPSKNGAEMIAVFKTANGEVKTRLVSALSPELLWAFSSGAEDVFLRNALKEKFPLLDVLKTLAAEHPYGIKGELERRRLREEGGGDPDFLKEAPPEKDGARFTGLLQGIVRELSEKLENARSL
jgi:intracellular multiplication protein IcmB